MHQSKLKLPRLLLLGALLCSTAAFADGRYTETFSQTAAGWQSDNLDSWSPANGDYRNAQGISGNTVAWYTGRQWTTNFTYKVRAYSDWWNTGNQIGVVFGLTDSTHYFEVLLNMAGQVQVNKVAGNANSPDVLATGTASGLAADTPFDLEVFVDGDNVIVKVNDTVVINGTDILATPVASGYLGFVARSNKVRFDDMSVTTQLFRGNFSRPDTTAIGFSGPVDCGADADDQEKFCYGRFSGLDSSGYTWPITLWLNGSTNPKDAGAIHYMSRSPTGNVTDFVEADIAQVTGHTGQPTRALHQVLHGKNAIQPQVPLAIRPKNTFAQQHDLYLRFWLQYPNAFTTNVNDYWQMPWQFVTDGAHNPDKDDESDELRVSLFATPSKGHDGHDCAPSPPGHWYWLIQGDKGVDDGDWKFHKCAVSSTVPTGRWFKVEIFLHRARTSSDAGRVWVAIDGNEIIDYDSQADSSNAVGNMYASGSPISRMNLPQMYGGDTYPREQYVDDVEIWDGFPSNASAHTP